MSEQTFRSPGFFEKEIDLTQRTREIEGVPAGVIGMANKGPAFVPVTVGSFIDFEGKFGTLNADYFGPYAVNEWLKNRTALTYVRVLGAGANSSSTDISTTESQGTVKNAGFKIKGATVKARDANSSELRHEGCVSFIAAHHDVHENQTNGYPIFTDNDSVESTAAMKLIRGMVFLASGARLELLSHSGSYTKTAVLDSDLATISSYDGTAEQGTFKLVLSSAASSNFGNDDGLSGLRIYTASLDPSSKYYYANVLNTNPDLFGSEQHLLYADFPVEDEVARVTYNATQATIGILSGSAGTSASSGDSSLSFRDMFGNFNARYQAARTTSFISQPFGSKEYDLFRFEAIDDGIAGNAKVKISITNLRRSTDPRQPYGTFTVLVRDFNDTDTNTRILEQYPLCNLNPKDENYIANVIGDMKVFYNFDAESESERRINVSGKRPLRSSFVRVIMNSEIESGQVPSEALPFGFRGIPVIKTTNSLNDGQTLPIGNGSANGRLGRVAKSIVDLATGGILTSSIVPPLPFRFKATRGVGSKAPAFAGDPGKLEIADNRYYWGVKCERVPLTSSLSDAIMQPNASSVPNELVKSYSKFLGIAKLDALVTGSGADAFNNNKFTLSRVALFNTPSSTTDSLSTVIAAEITGSADAHMREAAYVRDGKLSTPQYTLSDGVSDTRLTFASLINVDSAKFFNRFTDYMKFTNILYGGFDGLNILDKSQRTMNDLGSSVETPGRAAGDVWGYMNLHADSSPGAAKENNIINSYRAASRILTDEMSSRVNVVVVPGIREPYVTDYVSDLTKDYSKALYLMDIPSYDDGPARLYDNSSKRPNVRNSIEQFESRALDNNYVATYYPDVAIGDEVNGGNVNVPSSVVALGALAFNDSVAYPWFAPAGFNRGALNNVVNTKIRLNAEDRNVMYEARINPIANFPNGGFVIFGQKTLQQAKSALDRVNVRRMLLEVKRIVSDAAGKIIFEQNTPSTRSRFVAQVTPLLAVIQQQQGIDQFRVIMDSSNNNSEDIEQNKLNGKIILVPTRAVEFIAIDFIITNQGVVFE